MPDILKSLSLATVPVDGFTPVCPDESAAPGPRQPYWHGENGCGHHWKTWQTANVSNDQWSLGELSRYPGLGEVHIWSPAGPNPVFSLVCVSDNSVMHGSLTVVGWMVSSIFVAEDCARGSFKTWGMGWLLVGSSWVGNHLMKPTRPFTSSSSAIPSTVPANNFALLGCSGKNGYGMKVDSKPGQATRGIWKREETWKKHIFPQPRSVLEFAISKKKLHYCQSMQTPIPVYLSISTCRKWIMGRACPQIISQSISGYDHI